MQKFKLFKFPSVFSLFDINLLQMIPLEEIRRKNRSDIGNPKSYAVSKLCKFSKAFYIEKMENGAGRSSKNP